MTITLNYAIFDNGISEVYPSDVTLAEVTARNNGNLISTGKAVSLNHKFACENKSDELVLNAYLG